MSRILICLVFSASMFSASAQLPQGNRTLGWAIDLAENNSYDSAFAYAQQGCMESVHIAFTWSDLEPDTGEFNQEFIASILEVMNIYYPAFDTKVELQISPVNTNVLETPSELNSVEFDDPLMIQKFRRVLDTVFAHIPDVELTSLNISNESDSYFGNDEAAYTSFRTFLDSVAPYARQLYFNNQGTELKVGTTFTHGGLTDESTAAYCQDVNENMDVVSFTYYPLNGDFTVQSPEVVEEDFGEVANLYPAKPLHVVECGFPSSEVCNSSQELQADFYTSVFEAWDTHTPQMEYLTIFKSTDWSQETVDMLGEYYGLSDEGFLEFLRTLGVRTWPGNGTDKPAYERILCELEAREWCESADCATSGIGKTEAKTRIKLFPNPVENQLAVKWQNERPIAIEVLNSTGVRVVSLTNITGDQEKINTVNLSSGIHYIKIQFLENRSVTRKFMVK